MEQNIFKAYDVRGIYEKEIDETIVENIGRAGAHMLSEGEILIAHDVRHGSPSLALALKKGVEEEAATLGKKCIVTMIGLSTSPMFYFLVNDMKACGGFIVTASHNPPEYNGVKMVKTGAIPLSGKEIEKIYQEIIKK